MIVLHALNVVNSFSVLQAPKPDHDSDQSSSIKVASHFLDCHGDKAPSNDDE
ncbi:hypothetical protein Trichorick_01361 [Candidatus Trichorickettsia mobilis]|uniref:Uncharacterized protein n=1 Tax=Candidatus Trichorickettsia mobilis TaxID=1346319 RepID=A0ABZ0UWP2_9RICK|nr:hypothetical protein Trichorick_01361 [Candidatus Trichorickettsia mobilis]